MEDVIIDILSYLDKINLKNAAINNQYQHIIFKKNFWYYKFNKYNLPSVNLDNMQLYQQYFHKNKLDTLFILFNGLLKKTYPIFKFAVEFGYVNILIYLRNYQNEQGSFLHANNECALRRAARKGHYNVVQYLIHDGADVNANNHANNHDALKLSILHGDLRIVKYLVDHGANVHLNSDKALRMSASLGNMDIVKYLVEVCKCDIFADDHATLKNAILHKHYHIIKYLIDMGHHHFIFLRKRGVTITYNYIIDNIDDIIVKIIYKSTI